MKIYIIIVEDDGGLSSIYNVLLDKEKAQDCMNEFNEKDNHDWEARIDEWEVPE